MDFSAIRGVLADFINVEKRLTYESIQPCPFGQAYVRFSNFHDRDGMIFNSPHHFGDVQISFIPHDRAWDNRTVNLNHEVWLMLVGFPLDFWTYSVIEKALGSFGKLIACEEDYNHMARIMIKARVVELEDIPWFVLVSEGDDFESESWTVQVEILQSKMIGAIPQDSPPEDPEDINPQFFDFLLLRSARSGATGSSSWGCWRQSEWWTR